MALKASRPHRNPEDAREKRAARGSRSSRRQGTKLISRRKRLRGS